MNEALSLVLKHRRNGVLVDANVLLVYLVGKCDPNLLAEFHHTKQYKDDFPLIQRLVEAFRVVHTTPNILTEVSNLGGKLGPQFYKMLLVAIQVFQERYCTSKDAAINANFLTLGLTDAGILARTSKDVLVLTTDWPLYMVLRHNNVDAVNLNHLRLAEWSLHL